MTRYTPEEIRKMEEEDERAERILQVIVLVGMIFMWFWMAGA